MLLRRFMQHVKEQNWFAVGLDVCVVIAGIFLGMQVTNWNETRTENEKAKVYIERLRVDFAGNKKDLQERIVYFSIVRAHAKFALAALDGNNDSLDKDFVIDIYQARHILDRELGRDTYDEILSVGALSTESTIEVRKRLAIYYRSIAAQVINIDRRVPYRDIIRKTLPYDAQVLISDKCNEIITTESNGEPRIMLPENCEVDIPQPLLDESIDAILNADIEPALTQRVLLLDSILGSMRLILKRIELIDNDLSQWKKTIWTIHHFHK